MHCKRSPPRCSIRAIIAPANAFRYELYKKTLKDLRNAVKLRTGSCPLVLVDNSAVPSGNIILIKGVSYSKLLLTEPGSVIKMLRRFLAVGERHQKKIFFRTWSVGAGATGLMHTRPSVYRRIFNRIDSENLVVSTKYCGDDLDFPAYNFFEA